MPHRKRTEKNGYRRGEHHPRAKLSDREVDLLCELRGEGLSYGQLAEKFEIPKSSVASICQGRRR